MSSCNCSGHCFCTSVLPRCGLRAGLSLIEVLVVIAILGLLTGLLLAGVQRVREAAARAACSNNLRQIALAAHAYDSANGFLPPGLRGPQPGTRRTGTASYIGSLCYLLPYLEREDLHRQFPVGESFSWDPRAFPPKEVDWIDNLRLLELSKARIATFLCPSDPHFSATIGINAYFLPLGNVLYSRTYRIDPMTQASEVGRSNYIGNAGFMGDPSARGSRHGEITAQFRGPFRNRSMTRLTDINDGTSNTILFGETLGDTPAASPRGWENAWMGSGCLPTAWAMIATGHGRKTYASRHLGRVLFAYSDASVRSIRNLQMGTLPPQGVYRDWLRSTGSSDGEPIDSSNID